jgi:CelD/BcsL family acetyltransferase involved in cellulose biosynthesis
VKKSTHSSSEAAKTDRSPVRTRLIPLEDLTERDVDAWRELATATAEPNPFFEAGFVLAAARHLGHPGVALLVATGADGEWAACVPVQRRMRPAPHLRAWVHDHAHCSTPLVRADRLTEAVSALLDALVRPRLAAWSGFSQLRGDGPIGHALRSLVVERGITPIWSLTAERAALLPRTSVEGDGLQLLSGKQRSELRRKRRRLGDALGAEPELHVRAASTAALERLLRLENSGWKGEGGSSLFATPGGGEFFVDVCRSFAAEGRLELMELSAGDRPLSMTSALRAGDGVFGFKVADDRELGRFSPGMQVQVALGDKVLAEGPHTWIDSCSDPRNETQNRLWPHRRRIVQLLLPTRSPLTSAAGAAARRAMGAHAAAGSLPRAGAGPVPVSG